MPAFADPPVPNSKDGTILAYSTENTQCIEAAIVGDVLTLKKKDGSIEKLSMRALNRKGVSDVSTMWNLYCFYIVKDVWRGLIHQEKLMGQANVTLDVSKDGKYKIIRRAIYVPGVPTCLNDAPVPAGAREFWKQAKTCIDSVEFADMTIPGNNIESIKIDVIFGRDLEVFPRCAFWNYKNILLRDKWGKIKRGKSSL